MSPPVLECDTYLAEAICETQARNSVDDEGSKDPGGSQTFGIHSGTWAIDAYKVEGHWLDSMPPIEFPPGDDGMWNACAVG